MPVRIIGMSEYATSGDASLHVIEALVTGLSGLNLPARTSLPVLIWLVGYSSSSAEGFWSPCTPRCRQNGLAIS